VWLRKWLTSDQEVNKQIKEMIEHGIIRKSKFPYCSPKNKQTKQKFRLVVDYMNLNEITVNDKFPFPEWLRYWINLVDANTLEL